MNDTVKGITPEDDREHIISLYGHVKGVEREIELIKTNHLKHLDDKITHVHQDVEALGGKIDKIYWVVLTIPELCEAIGSSAKSQHAKGEAADFEIPGVDNMQLAIWINKNTDFDQLILEYYEPGDPNSGWVHCSAVKEGSRAQVLKATKVGGKTKYENVLLV
jgi:hypothetical protein